MDPCIKHLSVASDFGLSLDRLLTTGWSWTYQKNNPFLIHFWMKMKSSRDYLGLSNSCLYNVDDVIGRADRFGFQNFCSPAMHIYIFNQEMSEWLPQGLTTHLLT